MKVEPLSLEVNANEASLLVTVPRGPLVMDVVGGVVSTVKLELAGVASQFPAASHARTWKVCAPSARDEIAAGEEHGAYAPLSIAHWNTAPVSLALNVKVAALVAISDGGPLSIVVSGATVSIANGQLAGVGSQLVPLHARTWNVCAPSATEGYDAGDVHDA